MKEQERQRIDRMLELDKEELNPASRTAAVADFARVANEYFETEGPPVLNIVHDRRGFSVQLSFHAARVKNFTVLK